MKISAFLLNIHLTTSQTSENFLKVLGRYNYPNNLSYNFTIHMLAFSVILGLRKMWFHRHTINTSLLKGVSLGLPSWVEKPSGQKFQPTYPRAPSGFAGPY